jgi:hypothetical protein
VALLVTTVYPAVRKTEDIVESVSLTNQSTRDPDQTLSGIV